MDCGKPIWRSWALLGCWVILVLHYYSSVWYVRFIAMSTNYSPIRYIANSISSFSFFSLSILISLSLLPRNKMKSLKEDKTLWKETRDVPIKDFRNYRKGNPITVSTFRSARIRDGATKGFVHGLHPTWKLRSAMHAHSNRVGKQKTGRWWAWRG